jgi:hypothetical protein
VEKKRKEDKGKKGDTERESLGVSIVLDTENGGDVFHRNVSLFPNFKIALSIVTAVRTSNPNRSTTEA